MTEQPELQHRRMLDPDTGEWVMVAVPARDADEDQLGDGE